MRTIRETSLSEIFPKNGSWHISWFGGARYRNRRATDVDRFLSRFPSHETFGISPVTKRQGFADDGFQLSGTTTRGLFPLSPFFFVFLFFLPIVRARETGAHKTNPRFPFRIRFRVSLLPFGVLAQGEVYAHKTAPQKISACSETVAAQNRSVENRGKLYVADRFTALPL